jgi:glucose/mannose-6-phosphate isomerase
MLSFQIKAHRYCKKALELTECVSLGSFKPKTLIIAGVGGSAIGGELFKDWAFDKSDMPIEVCRSYKLPNYANNKTLVFVVSYSGETEETLSLFLEAIKKKCMIFCISSGGKLLDFAVKLNLPYLLVPKKIPPRAALPYLFLPIPVILEKIGVISGVYPEIFEGIETLKRVSEENSPDKPISTNFSKKLAYEINGSIPVIYGFGIYRAVAQRLKQQFNENSKVQAKWEFFPELNHNEIVGWEEASDLSNRFSLICIRDREESADIMQRIETTKELLSEKVGNIFEIWSIGKSKLARILTAISIGDFTSVYLAILRDIDPTPVKTINLFKQRTSNIGTKKRIISDLKKISKKRC